MDLQLQTGSCSQWQADVLLVPMYEDCDILQINQELATSCAYLKNSPAMHDLIAKKEALTIVHGENTAINRVLFIGLGKKEECNLDIFRTCVAKAMQYCCSRKFANILLQYDYLAQLEGGRDTLLKEAIYAAFISLYDGGLFKISTKKKEFQPSNFIIGCTANTDLQNMLQNAKNSAEAVALTRTLCTTPANLFTPIDFANKAIELAKQTTLKVRILDEHEMDKEGMHALLAVGQGSSNPPRLIILEHAPKGHENDQPLVYIGKGLCFDSGGISLKPPLGMHHMKGDMLGAGAVASALFTIAKEAVNRRVIGILACAENMPDGGAIKPGDVVHNLNGESIEIQNTDAEGRLVLCDALSYAQKYYNPLAIIDIATLTGACAVALGDELAGLFCTDAKLADEIIAAGYPCGEYYWQLPFHEHYAEKLRSEVADICHIASREGGAITAAMFLKHFVKNVPYAHLDVASVDWIENKTPLCPKGPSGFGTRTLIELAHGGF